MTYTLAVNFNHCKYLQQLKISVSVNGKCVLKHYFGQMQLSLISYTHYFPEQYVEYLF